MAEARTFVRCTGMDECKIFAKPQRVLLLTPARHKIWVKVRLAAPVRKRNRVGVGRLIPSAGG